jgi:hypothetical protein
MIERFAVDEYVGWIGLRAEVIRFFTFYGDCARRDPVARIAAAAIAEAGKKLIETAHG